MSSWQLHDAKAQSSDVIGRAQSEGPQTITRHGAGQTVVLSIEDYRSPAEDKPDFAEYLLGGPKPDGGLEIPRDDGFGWPINF